MLREIVLDTESTALFVPGGAERLVAVTALEMVDGKLTGRSFQVILNPEHPISAQATGVHGITNEMVQDKPVFADIAKELKDFIGNAPIVITCRTIDGITLDIDFLDFEMKRAGLEPFKAEQWVNVRRWAEEMFGPADATLDKIMEHYRLSHLKRDKNGHSATLDAQLLAHVYPRLRADYVKFQQRKQPKIKPPAP